MIFGKKQSSPATGVQELEKRDITDIHTHILPGIDDGSSSLQESGELLAMLAQQGIHRAVLTPHYYPAQQPPEEFLRLRAASAELLQAAAPQLELLLGAEVLYFRGISRLEALRSLCIEGTRTLLLEMPTDAWSEYMLREIAELQTHKGITVVMAHIERYFSGQPSACFDELLNMGIKFQVNAASFSEPKLKRKLTKMLKNRQIHFIGSDCHGASDRAPKMDKAAAAIKQYAGDEALDFIEQNCGKYLTQLKAK